MKSCNHRHCASLLFLWTVFVSWIITLSSVDAAFSSPHLGLGALLFKPKGMTVRSVRDSDKTDSELYDAGKFFADAFWYVGEIVSV